MAYTGIDKEIYDSGTHFRPLQEYTQQQWTPPAIMGQNTNAGIVNTQAAGSYMGYPSYEAWLLAQGGGGGPSPENFQGSSINQNLGPTNITDYESEAYGVGPTWAGSWAKLKDDFSNIPLPSNLLRKGIMKWKENREIKKQEKIAAEQARIDKISQQSQANAAAAGGGGAQSGITAGTTAAQAAGMGGGSRQATSAGSTKSDRDDGGWGWAQGGRIGYATRGFVDPEEPAENIFEIMQDQNIPFSEQVEAGPTEEQVAMVRDMDGRQMGIDEIVSLTGLGKEVVLSILGVDMAQGGIARLL